MNWWRWWMVCMVFTIQRFLEVAIIKKPKTSIWIIWLIQGFKEKNFFLRYCLRITKNTRHTGYFPLTVETTCYSVMTDGKNFICQPVKNITTYQNIRKITLIKEMIIKYDVLNYLSFYYLIGPRQSTLQRTLR